VSQDRSELVEALVLDHGWEVIGAPEGGPVLLRWVWGPGRQMAAQVTADGAVTLMLDVQPQPQAAAQNWLIEFGPDVPNLLVQKTAVGSTGYV